MRRWIRKDVEAPPVEDEGYVLYLYVHESIDSADYNLFGLS